MNWIVEFRNVSKRYKLGLTRVSLPSLIAEQSKRIFNRSAGNTTNGNYLYALKDISFCIGKGESLALIGSNGAGKTTILKLLANITKPTSGEISINGKLSALIELGSGFHPDLTGRENIYLNGTILGLSKTEIRKKFDEIVNFSELEKFIDTPVKRYSSGMAVRLGFAVAACIEPDIFLVDEVLAVGDSSFRQKCLKRIKKLINDGTSLIFVSHNLWMVQAVCQNAIYIDGGKMKYYGQTAQAIDLYDRSINEHRAESYIKSQLKNNNDIDADVFIKNIELGRENKYGITNFNNDQPLEIRVNYSSRRRFDEVNLVVRILRSDGLTCCMMRSRKDNFPISLNVGDGSISVLIHPLQLYGGTYFVQAMFRDSTDSFDVASAWSDWFYVSGSVLSHQEMNGVFEPIRKWHKEQ
jgi:lipopolysaccharide transport system ATP-binding protein